MSKADKKPRIMRGWTSKWLCAFNRPKWNSVYVGVIGYGETPMQAYADWKRKRGGASQ